MAATGTEAATGTTEAAGTVSGSGHTLALDIGGSAVKAGLLDDAGQLVSERLRTPVRYPCPPEAMCALVAELAAQLPGARRVGVGFPGMVRRGQVLSAPHFVTVAGPGTAVDADLQRAWAGYPLAAQIGQLAGAEVRLANDADVQGLPVVSGEGLELVLTLGTGFGTALFHDGELAPHLEFSHHGFRADQTYNEQVGDAARRAVGHHEWSRRVDLAVQAMHALTFYDRVYIGGGNAKHLTSAFAQDATIVENVNGLLGAAWLWRLSRVH